MITTRAGYRFKYVDDVDITGEIIPKIEVDGGTPYILRREDIAFLLEAVQQRVAVPSSWKSSVPTALSAQTLEGIKTSLVNLKTNTATPDVSNPQYTANLSVAYLNKNIQIPSSIIVSNSYPSITKSFVLSNTTGGALPTLKCESASFSGAPTISDMRKLYADIGEFKYGMNPYVFTEKIETSGSWYWSGLDTGGHSSDSGTFTLEDPTTLLHNGGPFANLEYEIRNYWTKDSSTGNWYNRRDENYANLSEYRINTYIKNVSDLWAVLIYSGSARMASESSYTQKYAVEFVKLNASAVSPYSGYGSVWTLPSTHLSTSHLDAVRVAMGLPEATAITDGGTSSKSNFTTMKLSFSNHYIFRISDYLLTAEVDSLGWTY